MATAIEMLKAATGEISLHTRVGRWMQTVSKLLDSATAVAAPQYSYQKRDGAAQTPINANTDLILDAAGANRGIPVAQLNGTLWTLTAGKTYDLQALGWFENFQADNDVLKIQWCDGNNAALVTNGIDCPGALFYSATSASKVSSAAGVEFVFTVPANATLQERTVKLRCTSATGQADLPAGSWSALIEEIPG